MAVKPEKTLSDVRNLVCFSVLLALLTAAFVVAQTPVNTSEPKSSAAVDYSWSLGTTELEDWRPPQRTTHEWVRVVSGRELNEGLEFASTGAETLVLVQPLEDSAAAGLESLQLQGTDLRSVVGTAPAQAGGGGEPTVDNPLPLKAGAQFLHLERASAEPLELVGQAVASDGRYLVHALEKGGKVGLRVSSEKTFYLEEDRLVVSFQLLSDDAIDVERAVAFLRAPGRDLVPGRVRLSGRDGTVEFAGFEAGSPDLGLHTVHLEVEARRGDRVLLRTATLALPIAENTARLGRAEMVPAEGGVVAEVEVLKAGRYEVRGVVQTKAGELIAFHSAADLQPGVHELRSKLPEGRLVQVQLMDLERFGVLAQRTGESMAADLR